MHLPFAIKPFYCNSAGFWCCTPALPRFVTRTEFAVALTVTEGELRRGATIVIKWNNLKDAQGRLLNGQVGPLQIP